MDYEMNDINGIMDKPLSRESLSLTFDFIKEWAVKMNRVRPKYNFDIIHNIHDFWIFNDFITEKQYKVLHKFWFKWRIYKTSKFNIEDVDMSIKLWINDGYGHIPLEKRNIGFPEDDTYPKELISKKKTECLIDDRWKIDNDFYDSGFPKIAEARVFGNQHIKPKYRGNYL